MTGRGLYQYKARDKFGEPIQGVMEADSESAVAARLKQTGYIPISVTPAKGESVFYRNFRLWQRIGFSDVNMFTRQLYTLQKAGVPLLGSLTALTEQTTNRNFKKVIQQVARDIETGSSFAVALERHPRVFNPLYINMIKSGEVSGRLAEVLERLASLGEHEEIIGLRIQAAFRYPLFVVISIVFGFLILTTFVMPRFAKVYSHFATALPLPTQILLGIHDVMIRFWWLLILGMILLAFLFQKFIQTKRGRFWWDAFKLKIPVLGPLLNKLIMSRFSRITGTLMCSGVPILQILELASDSVGNVVIARTIDNIKISVNEGRGMLEPMKLSGIFPPAVTQMVAVGEETGKIDELLIFVSEYYDAQIDHTINNLVSLVEPILIFILANVVLFMALGIFLPMWNLINLFKH
ncbi:MAG: type II secretion system F family protein [Candidatus Omnitrophota bacterium]